MTQKWFSTIEPDDNAHTDINEIEDALNSELSTHAGTSPPTYKVKGTKWYDTNFSPPKLKIYDGSNWQTIGTVDQWVVTDWTVNNVSDGSTFEIDSDVSSTLEPSGVAGRMVKIVQPTNGTVFSPVLSTSVSSGKTTVNLDPLRSKDLDSGEGVDNIFYGALDSSNDGALPLVTFDKLKEETVFETQGAAELDLTTTNTTTLIESGQIDAARGGDDIHVVEARAIVTTALAADNTTPVVTIQDGSSTSSGLTISTFSDGDAVDTHRIAEVSDGDSVTALDITSNKLEAKVTTAAADSGTAAGDCKVYVRVVAQK